MWGLHKKNQKKPDNNKQDELARKIADRIIRIRQYIIRKLEGIDSRLTQTQRKIVFYCCILIWSGCMCYILGNAVRQEPAPFVLPLYDSADIRQRAMFDSILEKQHKKIIHQQHKKTDNGKK